MKDEIQARGGMEADVGCYGSRRREREPVTARHPHLHRGIRRHEKKGRGSHPLPFFVCGIQKLLLGSDPGVGFHKVERAFIQGPSADGTLQVGLRAERVQGLHIG